MASPRPLPTAKLVCTAGPKAGSEFSLGDGEAVIGRATENSISIPDTSVSRKHVLIRKVAVGWAASDMGSGNGTVINGEPIAEETVLRNGDVITLGDTELSFLDNENSTDRRLAPRRVTSGAALARPRPMVRSSRMTRTQATHDPRAQQRRKKILKIGGIAASVVLLSIVGIKVYQKKSQEQQALANTRAQASRAEIGALFQEGNNLVREGKWTEAKVKFEEVYARNPNYPMLQDRLDRANKEIPNQEHLTAAATALSKNQLGPAKQAIDQVTPDTQLYVKLRAIRMQLEDKLAARLIEARALLDNNGHKDLDRMRQLEAIADDILIAYPDNRDATELSKQAKANIVELTKPPPVRVVEGPKPWLDVSARFRDGDVSGAFSLANECASRKIPQCKAQAGQISEFNEKYKKLESLSGKELNELLELDDKITNGGASKMVKLVVTRLTALYYKSASAAMAAGEYGRAVEFARKTLKVDPGHAGAQAIVSQLRVKSKDLFMQAYSLKETSPDEAIKLFRDVMAMTPKDDEHHLKSRGWIDKLDRQ